MTRDANGMRNMRLNNRTYYARLTIPSDRQGDVGKAMGAKNGRKEEVVRTLGTRDYRTAVRSRDAALDVLRGDVDKALLAAGLKPLYHPQPDTGSAPAWLSEALRDRENRLRRSGVREWDDTAQDVLPSDREGFDDDVWDRAQEIGEQHGGKAGLQYANIALGKTSPLRLLADRWLADTDGTITGQTMGHHKVALAYLGEFVAGRSGGDASTVLLTTDVSQVDRMMAGDFIEWLRTSKALAHKTVRSRTSSLSAFWSWMDRRGFVEGRSPWEGHFKGTKRVRAAGEVRKRPFTDDELVRLLKADPGADKPKGWKYAPALRDLLRLALLTGCRLNELCSLERRDVIHDGTGIRIRRETTKTDSGVRSVPLHALVQPIVAQRLAAAGAEDTAPLFPELPAAGPDKKRSWRLSPEFTGFRERVLGESQEVDFHSLRRCWSTFFANARNAGIPECSEDTHSRLFGHQPETLAGSVYTSRQFAWDVYVRAVDGMVAKGVSERVRSILSGC